MTRLIADEQLKARLAGFAETVEICDESGQVVGHFQPVEAPVSEREIYDWAKTAFTEEELEEGRNSPIWYTTQEILERLRSL